ncbi:hypothetical protein [Aquihabitans sp. McL0605]|uniref:hypothetical protein n=1 Tax=Aquihabitans sp. McL0605 TaxID=3415671 RepID=UPI003CEAC594
MVQPGSPPGASSAGRPSDGVDAIGACGAGDVVAAVLSLSEASSTGDDAGYLDWHLHDHLPEQHRLAGLRHGARFASTPECRAARLAEGGELDAVDHVVTYLFAPPVDVALDAFFALGAALRGAGRMPVSLPSVQVGAWWVDAAVASPAALVGAAVVPWRPATGILLVVEQVAADAPAPGLAALVDVPGVAGAWSLRGSGSCRAPLADTSGYEITLAYLDAPPPEVAERAAPVLRARWAQGSRTPVLAAPFHTVDPAAIGRFLPNQSAEIAS